MNEPARGDVVVITGASSGIGRATAHEFARYGCKLALLARGQRGLESCKREVEACGGEAIVIPTDVADAAQVEAAAEQVERELGPIRVWINDAAVVVLAPVWEVTPKEFERVTDVSYLGVVYGTLAALKRMRPRDTGAIVQIGSALSYRGIPLQAAYCAAQHAIQGFCDSLWPELRAENSHVTVSMVLPSGVNTPLWEHGRTKMKRLPRAIGRLYQPEVVARAIRFIAYNPRREICVGYESVKAVYGHKVLPSFADWDLARSGVERQAGDSFIDPNRPDNLFEPSPGDPGIHGAYSDESWSVSPQLWANMHRKSVGLATLGLAAAAGVYLGTRHR